MRYSKFLALPIMTFALLSAPRSAPAQVSINVGAEPACPYGYYDLAPYNCAPYGYYGPEWFNGGVFMGAGPWFHGSHDFHGHVDNRYDPQHGYAVRIRTVEIGPSITSTETRCVMGAATQAAEATLAEAIARTCRRRTHPSI